MARRVVSRTPAKTIAKTIERVAVRKSLIAVMVVALLGVAVPGGNAQTELQCGDVVKRSVVLGTSLLNCPDNGLIVGASRLTIDLNGHTIDGKSGSEAGIFNDHGYSDVVVRDGTITGFDDGVLIAARNATGNVLTDLLLDGNDVGIAIDGADENIIEDNEFAGGNDDGIEINGNGNVVEGNEILDEAPAIEIEGNDNEVANNDIVYPTASGRGGAIVFDGEDNLVENNDVFAGGDGVIGNGDDNIVDGNDLEGGSGDGIAIFGGSGNDVTGNDVEGYSDNGILVDSDAEKTLVSDNDVEGNRDDGIHVEADETTVEDNDVEDNGSDGINVDSDDSTIVDNHSDDNGDWGVLAKGDGVEGSGNDADDNGERTVQPGHALRGRFQRLVRAAHTDPSASTDSPKPALRPTHPVRYL